MKVKRACYLLLNVLLHLTTYGQQQQQQQDMVPVSPEAAALAKMVNYPVNLNTGVPDISIPLYTIETGGMVLPVTLQYHAGGFQINEHSTRAGLGWSLSCDLQITRTINGLNDFDFRGYLQNSGIKSHNPANDATYYPLGPDNWRQAYRFSAGELDGMPDKYYYKLLNKSGSFYFRKNDAGTGYTIVPVPYDNIRITFADNVFTIIDTDGTTYIFGAPGNSPDGTLAPVFKEISNTTFTTWKCRYVTNPTNTETISFTYQDKPTETFGSWNESIEFYSNPSSHPCSYYTQPQIEAAHPGSYSFEQLLIYYPFHWLSCPKYIEYFPDKKPVFHLPYVQVDGNGNEIIQDKTYPLENYGPGHGSGTTVRGIALSKIEFNGGSVEFTGTDKLTGIHVRGSDQSLYRSFAFYHSLSGDFIPGNRPTLYLDSLHVRNNSGEAIERYYLLYKNKLPFGEVLLGKDAWGFANAFTNYFGNEYDYFSYGSSIPHQKITHPVYFDCRSTAQNVTFSIGNEVNTELVDLEGSQRGILKRIVYPTGGYVNFDFESNKYKEPYTGNTMCIQMSGGLRIRAITYYDGKSYEPVSQKYYTYGDMEDGLGLVVDAPPKTFDGTTFKYNAYSYKQNVAYVTSYAGIATYCSGDDATPNCLRLETREDKTTYLPASAKNYTYPHGAQIYYTKVTEYNSDLGKETGKTVYSFYPPFQFTSNYHAKIPGTNIDYIHTNGLMGKQKLVEEYKYVNGRYDLVHSKEFTYTKYSQPTQVKVLYSFNNTEVRIVTGNYTGMQENLYNPDLGFAGYFSTGQYGIEVGTLLLTDEKEKWVSDAGTITQNITYTYNLPYLQPAAIETTRSDGTTIRRNLKYCHDFSSQPVYAQMLNRNMISQVIEEQVVASEGTLSTGRTNYDVFHNHFIAPKSVEKSFGDGPFKTEIQYDLYDNKANLLQSTTKDGIVTSYVWGYHYKYLLAKITGIGYSQATANIDVTTLQTTTAEAELRNTFNNLRTMSPSALITSFTYKPLTGISSTTDPSGSTRYFQYDAAGRLAVVKDNNHQIVQTYTYNMMNRLSFAAANMHPIITAYMESHNRTRPDNTKMIYNFRRPVGSVFGSDQDGGYYEPDEKDGIAEADVLIQLLGRFDPAKVSGLHLDLLKNGSVVYTKKIKASNDYTPIEFYIPHGEYQVNLRLDDNYQNVILNNYFSSPPGENHPANDFMLNGPATINFVPGITYSITSFDH